MNNDPTIIAASLEDSELQKSIDSLVNKVKQGTDLMKGYMTSAVADMKKQLQSLGDISINMSGNVNDGGASTRAKANIKDRASIEASNKAYEDYIKTLDSMNKELTGLRRKEQELQQSRVNTKDDATGSEARTKAYKAEADELQRLRTERQNIASTPAIRKAETGTGVAIKNYQAEQAAYDALITKKKELEAVRQQALQTAQNTTQIDGQILKLEQQIEQQEKNVANAKDLATRAQNREIEIKQRRAELDRQIEAQSAKTSDAKKQMNQALKEEAVAQQKNIAIDRELLDVQGKISAKEREIAEYKQKNAQIAAQSIASNTAYATSFDAVDAASKKAVRGISGVATSTKQVDEAINKGATSADNYAKSLGRIDPKAILKELGTAITMPTTSLDAATKKLEALQAVGGKMNANKELFNEAQFRRMETTVESVTKKIQWLKEMTPQKEVRFVLSFPSGSIDTAETKLKKLQNLAEKYEGKGILDPILWNRIQASIETTTGKIERFKANIPNQEIKVALAMPDKSIESVTAKMRELNSLRDKYKDNKNVVGTESWNKLQAAIEAASQKFENLKAKMQKSFNVEVKMPVQSVEEYEKRIERLRQMLSEMQRYGVFDNAKLKENSDLIARMQQEVAKMKTGSVALPTVETKSARESFMVFINEYSKQASEIQKKISAEQERLSKTPLGQFAPETRTQLAQLDAQIEQTKEKIQQLYTEEKRLNNEALAQKTSSPKFDELWNAKYKARYDRVDAGEHLKQLEQQRGDVIAADPAIKKIDAQIEQTREKIRKLYEEEKAYNNKAMSLKVSSEEGAKAWNAKYDKRDERIKQEELLLQLTKERQRLTSVDPINTQKPTLEQLQAEHDGIISKIRTEGSEEKKVTSEKEKQIAKEKELKNLREQTVNKMAAMPQKDLWSTFGTVNNKSVKDIDEAKEKLSQLKLVQEAIKKNGLFDEVKLSRVQKAIDNLEIKISKLGGTRVVEPIAVPTGLAQQASEMLGNQIRAYREQIRELASEAKSAFKINDKIPYQMSLRTIGGNAYDANIYSENDARSQGLTIEQQILEAMKMRKLISDQEAQTLANKNKLSAERLATEKQIAEFAAKNLTTKTGDHNYILARRQQEVSMYTKGMDGMSDTQIPWKKININEGQFKELDKLESKLQQCVYGYLKLSDAQKESAAGDAARAEINALLEKRVELLRQVAATQAQVQSKAQGNKGQGGEQGEFAAYAKLLSKLAELTGMREKDILAMHREGASSAELTKYLSKLKDAYNNLGKGGKQSNFGKEVEREIFKIEKALNRIKTQSERPVHLSVVLDLPDKSIDDLAFKIQKLKSYRSGININSTEGAAELIKVNKELKEAEDRMKLYIDRANGVFSANNALGRSWNYMKNRLAFYFTVGASTQFLKQLIDIRGQYEVLERSMGILFDSMQTGTRIFAELNAMAIKSPFTTMELGAAAKQLTAYDVAAKDVVDTTRRLADMAAAVGIPIERLTYALGQIKAYGYLNARDARMFANAGIPLVKELADRYTELEGRLVSTSDVYDRIKKKAISYEDVMGTVNKMTDEGGKFFNFQEKAADTLKVKLANLTLAWNNFLNEVGKAEQGMITEGLGVVKTMLEHWRDIDQAVWGIVKTVGFLKGAQLLLLATVKRITWEEKMQLLLGNKLGVMFYGIASSLKALALNPMTWITAAVVGAGYLYQKYQDLKEANESFNKSIKTNAEENIKSIDKFLGEYKNMLDGISQQNLANQKKMWERIQEEIEKSTKNAKDYIKGLEQINDIGERITGGRAILEQSKVIEDEIKRLAGKGWFNVGGGFADDELAEDLKEVEDYINKVELKYGSLKKANQEIDEGLFNFVERWQNVNFSRNLYEAQQGLNEFTARLDKADLSKIMGEGTGEQQLARIRDFTNGVRDAFLATERGSKLGADARTRINYALDNWIAKQGVANNLINKEREEVEKTRSIWEIFFEYINSKDKERLDFLHKSGKESSTTFQEIWKSAAKEMAEKSATAYNAIKAHIDDLNTQKIVIDVVYNEQKNAQDEIQKDFTERFLTPSTLKFPDVDDYFAEQKRLTERYGKFIRKNTEDNIEWEKRLQDEKASTIKVYEQSIHTISELEKELRTKEERDADARWQEAIRNRDSSKQDLEAIKDVQEAYKLRDKEKKGSQKDVLLDALKNEIDIIKKLQNEYNKLVKEGASSGEALRELDGAFGKTVKSINEKLKSFGLPKLDLSIVKGQDQRDILKYLTDLRDTLSAKGLGNTERYKTVEAAIQEVRVSVKSYDLSMITKGLNNELGKLKEEYELAVAFDANPELGDFFAQSLGIDLEEIKKMPRNYEQVAQKAQDSINKILAPAYEQAIKDVQKAERELLEEMGKGDVIKAIEKNFGTGSVIARPLVDAAELVKKGWKDAAQSISDTPETKNIATVFSSSYDIKDKEGQTRKILVTPILPDGTILTQAELEKYIDETLEGAGNILEADTKNIVLGVDVKGDAGEELHKLHEALYNLPTDKLEEIKKLYSDIGEFNLQEMFNKEDFDKWVEGMGKALDSNQVNALKLIVEFLRKLFIDESKRTQKEFDDLLKKYSEFETKVKLIRDKAATTRRNLVDLYGTDEEKAAANTAKRTVLTSKDEKEVEEASKKLKTIVETIAQRNPIALPISLAINKEENKEQADVIFKHLKESDDYERFFNSINTLTMDSALKIKGEIRKGIVAAFKDGALSVSQFKKEIKALEDQFDKLTQNNQNWFVYMKDGFNGLIQKAKETGNEIEAIGAKMGKEGKVDKKDQEYLDSFGKIFWGKDGGEGGLKNFSSLMQEFGNDFEGLGKQTAAAGQNMQGAASDFQGAVTIVDMIIKNIHQTVQAIGSVIEELDSMRSEDNKISNSYWQNFQKYDNYASSGWENLKSGNIGGATGDTVNSFIVLYRQISKFDRKQEKINKSIKESQREVKNLELAYKDLQDAINNSYGAQKWAAQQAAAANKELQLLELKRQLELEESRDSKIKDTDKIQELKGQIKDLEIEIKNASNEMVSDLLGISSVGDAAESLVLSMVNAFRQGEKYMEEYDKSYESMINNMIAKTFASLIIGDKLQELWDKIKKNAEERAKGEKGRIESIEYQLEKAKNGEVLPNQPKSRLRAGQYSSEAEKQADIARLEKEREEAQKAYAEALKPTPSDIKNATSDMKAWKKSVNSIFLSVMDSIGVKFGDQKKFNLSALQQGIQGITEDTASALEAYMNGVSQQVYQQTNILSQIRDAVALPENVQQLAALKQVRDSIDGMESDAQLGTMSQMLLQLQASYQVQMTIQGILSGWSNANGMAVRVEMV